MPDLRDCVLRTVLVLALGLPLGVRAQQPDSAAARDSIRADSIRRSELARIRGEASARVDLRAVVDTLSRDDSWRGRLQMNAASVAADMITDLSPKAAARSAGPRIRLRDIEASIEATYASRVTGVLSLSLTDDGTTPEVIATDAAVSVPLHGFGAEARVIAGRTALPFGRSAQLHRHVLPLPDQPLPVRALLGETGLRGTGLQLRSSRTLGGLPFSLDLAVADRFGARVDSLHPGEPPDQFVAGIAAGGRFGTRFDALRSRVTLGVSSITGKREQPIACAYQTTVGPVPCPQGVNAANTRLTVLGADARAAWGGGGMEIFAISAEWMRMVVGATDLPVFTNTNFAAFYQGVHGTYDGGYVDATLGVGRGMVIGGRAEWLQNPQVAGLNDGWLGGYAGLVALEGTRVVVSYQRRMPSSNASAALNAAERDARDRVVVRGTIILGRHPGAGRG